MWPKINARDSWVEGIQRKDNAAHIEDKIEAFSDIEAFLGLTRYVITRLNNSVQREKKGISQQIGDVIEWEVL